MTAQRWHIDPTNPGEVLACAGIAHLAWRAQKDARTGFVDGETFVVEDGPGDVFSMLRPMELHNAHHALLICGARLDWWTEWGLSLAVKLWSGRQSAFTVHRSLINATKGTKPDEWLSHIARTTGRLNVDTLGSWNALNIGWSINEHEHIRMLCRPWIELLSSFCLQVFAVPGKRGAPIRYTLWRPLSLPAAVAAFTGYGRGVYSDSQFEALTADSGKNLLLTTARAM